MGWAGGLGGGGGSGREANAKVHNTFWVVGGVGVVGGWWVVGGGLGKMGRTHVPTCQKVTRLNRLHSLLELS